MTAKKSKTPGAKKETGAATKENDAGQAKKEYRIEQSENGRTHQIVWRIFQKITWTSDNGLAPRIEWTPVREWKLGMKAGFQLDQILRNLAEANQGKPLSPISEYNGNPPKRYHYTGEEENEDGDEDF